MTTEEFSNAFDVLLNSHNNQSNFGDVQSVQEIILDEYEKSLLLTQAQLQLVTELYTGRNEKQASFEASEELRSNLRSLIRSAELVENNSYPLDGTQVYELPKDLLYIIYEEAVILGKTIKVVPTTWDSLQIVINNPFKRPNKNRALRVDLNGQYIRVFRQHTIDKYSIQYLIKPTPIILTNLEGVAIEGENKITECKLDSSLHDTILKKAVVLAIAIKRGQSQN